LLHLADALGSSKAALLSCVTDLDSLVVATKVEDQQVELTASASSCGLYFDGGRLYLNNPCGCPDQDDSELACSQVFSEAAEQELRERFAAQTEQLLWLAYRLQLAPLVRRLHVFLRTNMSMDNGILEGMAELVFSERVLDSALGSNRLDTDAWIDSILQDEHTLEPGSADALFQPVGLSQEQQEPITFDAVLQKDFMGAPAGTQLQVTFDLLGSGRVHIGQYYFKASLRLL
jgi:hypothetical protein